MTMNEKLKEFVECEDYMKFNGNSIKTYRFSDGKIMSLWFSCNKDKILNSNNDVCIIIKEQYQTYKQMIKNTKTKYVSIIYSTSRLRNSYIEEFANCDDLSKFDASCNIYFKNSDINMYKWFLKNYNYLIAKECDACDKIKNQLKEKRRIDEQKNKLQMIKYKHIFVREKDLNKFDHAYNLKFPDGKSMSSWFETNSNELLNSNNPVELMIKEQYDTFVGIMSLKLEFLNDDNMEKYNENSYVRFSTGAVKGAWWEVNKKSILDSKNPIDIAISNQYKNYINPDDKSNKLIKKY